MERWFGVKNDAVSKEIECVMEDVDAVGDATQPAEKAPTRHRGDPAGRLGDDRKQKGAIKDGEPSVSNGDSNGVDRMNKPPEQSEDA